MSALFFIIRKSVKNSLKEIFKKPGKLTLYLFIIAMLIFVILVTFFNKAEYETHAHVFWFTGILFAFITIFLVIAVSKGFSSGDTIFEMNDVNLLFVSPVSSRKILMYGIIRMAKTAFLAGFFILFQSSLLANFGFGFSGVFLTFAGFILSVIILTIISLIIYSVTNGKEPRKRLVKIIAAAFFTPAVCFFIIKYFNTRDVLLALEMTIKSPFLIFIPVAGWTANAVSLFLSGDLLNGFIFFGLNLGLGAGMITYIILSNPDYYEDVLVATETNYEKKRALTESNIGAATVSARKVKVSKTGISGSGASSIFYKHIRESFRENRFGFLTLTSVLFIAGAAAVSFFIKDILTVMQVLMWTQIMLIGTGRGLKETYSHYIYMIPESSFKKIIWSNMEVIIKTFIESVLIFGISGILISANPVFIILCIITYTLFSFVLLGVNYLFMRFTGADLSRGVLLMIYFFAVILIMAPGITFALLAGFMIGEEAGLFTGLLILSAWELAAGLACFALSKGVLHNCDISALKQSK